MDSRDLVGTKQGEEVEAPSPASFLADTVRAVMPILEKLSRSELQHRLIRAEGERDLLKEQLRIAEERCTALMVDMKAVRLDVVRLEARLAAKDEEIQGLKAANKMMHLKIEKHETTIAGHETTIAGHETTIAGHETTIRDLAAQLTAHKEAHDNDLAAQGAAFREALEADLAAQGAVFREALEEQGVKLRNEMKAMNDRHREASDSWSTDRDELQARLLESDLRNALLRAGSYAHFIQRQIISKMVTTEEFRVCARMTLPQCIASKDVASITSEALATFCGAVFQEHSRSITSACKEVAQVRAEDAAHKPIRLDTVRRSAKMLRTQGVSQAQRDAAEDLQFLLKIGDKLFDNDQGKHQYAVSGFVECPEFSGTLH